LPLDSITVDRTTGDVDGDGQEEIVVVYRAVREQGLRVAVLHAIAAPSPNFWVEWNTGELRGTQSRALRLQDLTGDGVPDIISLQSNGTGSSFMYIYTNRPVAYRALTPTGGPLDGLPYFGEGPVRLEDVDGDGRLEILVGPQTGGENLLVYHWDGVTYRYTGYWPVQQ
jgi:hypothetical protein